LKCYKAGQHGDEYSAAAADLGLLSVTCRECSAIRHHRASEVSKSFSNYMFLYQL
jgi:hypothetical protein